MKQPRQSEDWQTILGVIIVAALLAIIFAGCRGSEPEARPIIRAVDTPETVIDAQKSADELRADVALMVAQIKNLEAQELRLLERERRAKLETLARAIQWIAALAALGGVALTVLGFINPALRPLRTLAAIGGSAALLIFGLAGYIPQAAESLGPVAVLLSVAGGAWIIWRQWVDRSAAVGAINVAEELKHLSVEPNRVRIAAQKQAAGRYSKAIDSVRKSMGNI